MPFSVSHSNLPERPFQMLDEWWMNLFKTEFDNQLDNALKILAHFSRKRLDLFFDFLVEIVNPPSHLNYTFFAIRSLPRPLYLNT